MDTNNHGEMIDCITHHVCQEIQSVDEDGADVVDEDADDVHAGGGWSPPEAIPAAVPPSDLRRRCLLTLFLGIFDLRLRRLRESPGDPLYSQF